MKGTIVGTGYVGLVGGDYREAYGLYACNGILFNHASPLRGETFVTRKITRAMARIALGLQDCLHLGNLSALRDWGHARDYIEMQWLMLQQQQQAEDFVIATGVQVSVREFVQRAAAELGITVAFSGNGEGEAGTVAAVNYDRARCETGDVVVRAIRATSGRRKWRPCSAIPARPSKSWAGRRPRRWQNSRGKWSTATMWLPSATAWSSGPATKPSTITNALYWIGTQDTRAP